MREKHPFWGALVVANFFLLFSASVFANELNDKDRNLIASYADFCSEEMCSPYSEFTYVKADLDGIGEKNYIFGLGETEDDLAVLVLFKSNGKELSKLYEKASLSLGYMGTVSALDVDGDAASELIVTQLQGAGAHYTSTWIYSWNNGVFSSLVPGKVDSHYGFAALDHAEFVDLNGDGKLEVISNSAFRNVEEIYGGKIISTLYVLHGGVFKSVGKITANFLFSRGEGSPEQVCEDLALEVGGDYGVFAINNERFPVSNVALSVNDDIVFTSGDFNEQTKKKYKSISLSQSNLICASVQGKPGSSLRLMIGKFEDDF